ncbi:MAG: hypothetical protein Kow00109_19410 [Acidobacteriota bacterium]
MREMLRLTFLKRCLLAFLAVGVTGSPVWAAEWLPPRNVAAGFHVGLGSARDVVGPPRDGTPELGVWLQLQPAEHWWISFDWAYLPRDSFFPPYAGIPYGETERNRQVVDCTLQYRFLTFSGFRPYVELGGGFLWNNRTVLNPEYLPGFPEPGKESTREFVFSVGAGVVRSLNRHLHWIVGWKTHHPGSRSLQTDRVFTGLAVSWR